MSLFARLQGIASCCLTLAVVSLALAADSASAQAVAPNCSTFEYDQKPNMTTLAWSPVLQGADEEFGASGVTLEEGIVNGSGALVGLTGANITKVRVWGWTFDFSNIATGTVHQGVVFCGADTANRTEWNITFRAAGPDAETPGDLLATRTVSYSRLVFSTAGINFNNDGNPMTPGPFVACDSAQPQPPNSTCTQTGEWTFEFPPVSSANVRWIGVQQQQGVDAPDGHPCAQTLLMETDASTYDDASFQRGATDPTLNQDLLTCVGTTTLATLDIDGSGESEPLSDGLLGLRSLFGFSGGSLSTGTTEDDCTRCTSTVLEEYTDELEDLDLIDIDGNGTPDPLTDGILFLRYLFGFRGPTLIAGAVGAGATRNTAPLIESYIAGLI